MGDDDVRWTPMSLSIILDAAGGLALFVLAMGMMTDGLKAFAGSSLRQLLGTWTSTPARGVLAGILVTGLVQSSGAVTVATIGFVNAGLLTLRQALGVVFGTNIGTTMTGWFVSLVGFGVNIESFALPMLALGVILRLIARGKRFQGLGEALAGFGLFFLGLGILKDAFGDVANAYGTTMAFAEHSRLTFVLFGFVATVLTQSSSASIAVILTAAARGVLSLDVAAAAVIGANLGSTSTAALAVLRSTPNARRLALGHILFNAVTGAIALALLPLLLWLVSELADGLDIEGSPAAFLALFHTVFNTIGVLLMLPLTGRLTHVLERLFRNAEEDLARPQHLDATLTTTPELAIPALRAELLRLRSQVTGIVHAAVSGPVDRTEAVQHQAAAAQQLGVAVARFAAGVRTASMPSDVGADLARCLRIGRYLDEAARLAPRSAKLHADAAHLPDKEIRSLLAGFLARAGECVALAAHNPEESGDLTRSAAFDHFERTYEQTKATLLHAAVAHRVSVEMTDGLLTALSATRRLIEQLVKADRLLRSPDRAAAIEAEPMSEHTE